MNMYQESRIVLVPGAIWIRFFIMERLREKKACSMNENGLETILYMNNCAGHVNTPQSEEDAAVINNKIWKLVANAMDLIQPLDLFVIMKIKDIWRASWYKYDTELKIGGLFQDKLNTKGQYYGIKQNQWR